MDPLMNNLLGRASADARPPIFSAGETIHAAIDRNTIAGVLGHALIFNAVNNLSMQLFDIARMQSRAAERAQFEMVREMSANARILARIRRNALAEAVARLKAEAAAEFQRDFAR